MARVQIATDDFNRADGELGANWTNLSPANATADVASNAVHAADTAQDQAARWDGAGSFADDQYAKIAISGLTFEQATFRGGVVARASADINAARDFYACYVVYDSAGPNYTTVIARIVNGALTSLNSVARPWANGDTVELEVTTLDASTVRLIGYRNGTAFVTVDDTNAARLLTGKPGLYIQGNATTPVLDNWEGGSVVTATEEQEGFRFGNDDGSESAHTWKEAQDTSITAVLGENALLRLLVNATEDTASANYTLRYQKNGAGGYAAVPVGASSVVSPPAAPAATVTTIGTAVDPWAINRPAANTGDLVVFVIAWDDSTAVANVAAPAGVNGETAVSIAGPIASNGTEMRAQAWYYVATGAWTTGTLSFNPDAAETCRAVAFVVPAGEFKASDPIGFANTRASAGTAETDVLSPTGTAEGDDGSGRLYIAFGSDADALTAPGANWNTINNATGGGVGLLVGSRDALVSNSESITALTATIAGDSWATLCFVVKPATVTNEVYVSPSANITAGGEATTARLAAPAGKTTGDFVTGRRWDDENGADAIDITTDDYTELEWCLHAQSPAQNGDFFDFRVYAGSSPLNAYTVTPRWTLGTPPAPADAGNRYRHGLHPSRGPFNPAQFMMRRTTREVLLQAASLSILDAEHAHAADNLALTQEHTLAVQGSEHAHAADNLALTQEHLLAIQDALHAHEADNLTLSVAVALLVDDALHAHEAGSLDLTQLHLLQVADAIHAHLADGLALTQEHVLALADAIHAHAADNLALTQEHVLALADALHPHSSENVVLEAEGTLAIQDALHAHLADGLALTQEHVLALADAIHAHLADGDLLLDQETTLVLADAAHAHLADGLALTQLHVLSIDQALHAHLADEVFVVPGDFVPGAERLLAFAARHRALVVRAGSTTLVILPTHRTLH